MKQYNYPKAIPIAKLLKISSKFAKNPIPFQKQFFDEYGDTIAIKKIGGKRILLTRDLEVAKHVLQKKHKIYDKSEIQSKHLAKYIGYGLLTSNGSYWKQQRRLIQPAFHKEKLKRLVVIIDASIKKQLTDVKTDVYVDVYSMMNHLAFKVVAQSLFHFSIGEETSKRLQLIIEELQKFVVLELRKPHLAWYFKLSGAIKHHKKLAEESRVIILSIIEERRNSKESHDDLLDMLLQSTYEDGSGMTNEQLIDEILILFVAGHETTANSLTFTLGLLAKYPEEVQHVRKETKGITELSVFEQLGHLQHTKHCVEESLRLYPPAWITDRVNTEDDQIGDYKLKKGTLIGVSIYELHRNIKYWENPDAFIPARFNGFKAQKTPEAYMPFGAGPRLCIGNSFAMYEMMLTIQEIVKKFDLQLSPDGFSYNPLITLRPVGVKVKFTKLG